MINRDAEVPVVLVSAHQEAELLVRSGAEHIMAYLVKPVKPADLQAALTLAVLRFEQYQRVRSRRLACGRRWRIASSSNRPRASPCAGCASMRRKRTSVCASCRASTTGSYRSRSASAGGRWDSSKLWKNSAGCRQSRPTRSCSPEIPSHC